MAIAIMGGTITSTFLTLFVAPLAYGAVVGIQDRLSARRARRRAAKEHAEAAKAAQRALGDSAPQAAGD